MTKVPRTIDDLREVSSKSQEQKKQRVLSNGIQLNKPNEASPNPNTIAKENPQIPDPDLQFSLTLVNPRLFICSFCHKLLTTPVLQCTAEKHTLCSICAPELEDKRCRHCFSTTFKDYYLINDMLESFQVSCRNVGFGCGETAMSLGKKRSHEEGCVFVPCSCPLCDFLGPISQLVAHFRSHQIDPRKKFSSDFVETFNYNTSFTITLFSIKGSAVFQEEKDGDLFVAFNEVIKDVGIAVSVRRMGPIRPPSPGREYFYEIELHKILFNYRYEKMKDNMSLKLVSPMMSVRSRLEKPPPRSTFLLVPEGLFSDDDSLFELKLTVRIWWQNVK